MVKRMLLKVNCISLLLDNQGLPNHGLYKGEVDGKAAGKGNKYAVYSSSQHVKGQAKFYREISTVPLLNAADKSKYLCMYGEVLHIGTRGCRARLRQTEKLCQQFSSNFN